MTRTTDTQATPFIESFGDTMTPLINVASEVARESTEMYMRGLNAIVEQQRLTWEASQRWFSGIVSTQAPLSGQLVESLNAVGGKLLQTAEEATTRGGEAGADATKRSTDAVARATRKAGQAATTPRRRPTQARSTAAPSAERPGPAKWTGEVYDALTAAEVVEQLPKLSQREVRELERYETRKSRDGVLNAADAQLSKA